jgi:PAS domain S-box-containing protein/putative nucleotidyltransferase with HDIG domain
MFLNRDEVLSLDLIIASSPVVILWGEPEERHPVDFVTGNICRFGYSVPQIVLEEVPFESLVFPEDWERLKGEFRAAVLGTGVSLMLEYRIVTRGGEVRWVEDRTAFHRDSEGKAYAYQSSLLDVTDRKTAERRAKESEERLARVLASSRVGIWEYSPLTDSFSGSGHGPLLGIPETAFPFSRHDFFDRFLSSKENETAGQAWEALLSGQSGFLDTECRVTLPGGTVRWVVFKGFPVRDGEGLLLRVKGLTIDVSGLKEAELRAEAQNRRLELLHSMFLSFMEELDSRALLRSILTKACSLAGTEHGSLSVYQEKKNTFLRVFGTGLYASMADESRPVFMGISGEVFRTRKRSIIRDYGRHPGRTPDSRLAGITTIISMPFFQGKTFMGTLAIAYTDGYPELDDELLASLDQFAAAAAIALENARLYEESRRELEERRRAEERLRFHGRIVEAAAEGASFLLSLENGEQALKFALRSLGEALGARRVTMFRNSTGPDGKELVRLLARSSATWAKGDPFLPDTLSWEGNLSAVHSLLAGGGIFTGPISEFCPVPGGSAAHSESLDFMAVPVLIGSGFWGFLGFSFEGMKIPLRTEKADVLRAAAYNMAASVIRWESEKEVLRGYEKLQNTFNDVIRTMGQIVGKKDPYTIEHQERVAMLAMKIGAALGLGGERLEGLRIAGLVHDVGKVEIPSEILSKPGRLSPLEFELIKTHAESSYHILKEIDFPWPVAEIAWQHHEKLDGSGYPRGLRGDEIMLEARILTVADVVEAMASHRPYRPSLGLETARSEIEKHSGTRYDPEVVKACAAVLEDNPGILTVL